MKKRLTKLLVVLIFSCLLVVGLFKLSESTARNGFVRAVPIGTLRPKFSSKLSNLNLYFVGSSGKRVFLGSLDSSGMVVVQIRMSLELSVNERAQGNNLQFIFSHIGNHFGKQS